MPFLVVETIENGSKKLSVCPEGWVANDILRWPTKKALKKSKKEELLPKESWIKLPCIIKRKLNSYEDAEEELKEMIQRPETDHESYVNLNTASIQSIINEDFNQFAKQLSSNQNAPTADYISIMVPNDNVTNQNIDHAHVNEVQVIDYDSLAINQKILSENQNTIIDNQVKMMKTLSTLSVKIDKIASVLYQESQMPVTKLSNEIRHNPFNAKVKPISSFDDLQHMETQLRDPERRKQYKDIYSVFCTPGKNGKICAFQLIEILFTREFLVHCSWSGSARGTGTKISIKIFQEVLGLFFEIVHDCDPKWTVDQNNEFFKSMVKNALKRTQTKLERTSAPRQVPKRKVAPEQQIENKKICKQSGGSHSTDKEATGQAQAQGQGQRQEQGQGQEQGQSPEQGQGQEQGKGQGQEHGQEQGQNQSQGQKQVQG